MRKYLAVAGIVLCLSQLAQAQPESIELLYQKALHLETAKADYDGAIPLYAEILSQHLENTTLAAKALFRQGLCYEKIGKADLAKECATKLARDFADALTANTEISQWAQRFSPATGVDSKSLDLPWVPAYAEALAKAKAEKKPIFLMLAAVWSDQCRSLEANTLKDPFIREALQDFVWVKAYEDKNLNRQFGQNGYPTLVFINAETEMPFFINHGYEAPGPFLSTIVANRKMMGMEVPEKLQTLSASVFQPDREKLRALERNGDAQGLLKYLEPVAADRFRKTDWLVLKFTKPEDLSWSDVVLVTDQDRTGDITPVIATPVQENKPWSLLVQAFGYRQIRYSINADPNSPAVSEKEIRLEKLADSEKAVLEGTVVDHQGLPVANAIVRLCDWSMIRADSEGRYKIEQISPGTFTLRGESPGGEKQEEVSFLAGEKKTQNIRLDPVTTVGIRWTLQTREGATNLEGDGAKSGEAYFSIAHSRFLLERGAEVRTLWGSDFMMINDLEKYKKHLSPESLATLKTAPSGAPFFWLFDATSRNSGLHLDDRTYDQIKEIPASMAEKVKAFQFLRGNLLRKGETYLVRSCRRNTYAKLEITDVTLVPNVTQGNGAMDLAKLELPDTATRERAKAYIEAVLKTTRGRNQLSSRDPEVGMLQKAGAGRLDLLIDALSEARKGGGLQNHLLLYAIAALADQPSKPLILSRLEQNRELVTIVVKSGWEQDAKPTLLAALRESRSQSYLPVEWIQAVSNLQDPSTYSFLREYFIRGLNTEYTYKAIQNLPIPDLAGAVAEVWKKSKTADLARIALSYGHKDAVDVLIARLEALGPGTSSLWELKEIQESVRLSTNFKGLNSEMLEWLKTNRATLRYDAALKKFLGEETRITQKNAQAIQRLSESFATSQGSAPASSHDPQVSEIVEVGRQNFGLLLQSWVSRDYQAASGKNNWRAKAYLEFAIAELTNEENKPLILKLLRETLLKSEDTVYLPPDWIEALARLRDPSTYPLLRDFLVRGLNKVHTYRAVQNLPIPDMAGAIADVWKKSKSVDFAWIALSFGHSDAMDVLMSRLEALGSDTESLGELNAIGEGIRRATSFRGLNSEMLDWLKTNRANLRYDSALKKFLGNDTGLSQEDLKHLRRISEICATSSGSGLASSTDPQVSALVEVGREHFELLLQSLMSRVDGSASPQENWRGQTHLEFAVAELANEENKPLILKYLQDYKLLVRIVVNRGWEQDAKPILRSALLSALLDPNSTPYVHVEWIRAMVKLEDPSIYPYLREYLIRGRNKEHTYNAIQKLPMIDLAGAVTAAWAQAATDPDTSPLFAQIAAEYGLQDALSFLVKAATQPTPEKGARDTRAAASKAFRTVTDFTGPDDQLQKWFEEKRLLLEFDSEKHKFLTRLPGKNP